MRAAVLAFAVASPLTACVIDAPHYIMIDGEPDANQCIPGCDGDEFVSCEGGAETRTTCALGCSTFDSVERCGELGPSNDVELSNLDDVTDGITIATEWTYTLDTNSGAISAIDPQGSSLLVRAAGDGIVDGIGYVEVPGAHGIFSIDGLEIQKGGTLTATGTLPLIILSRGDVVINGVIALAATIPSNPGVCPTGQNTLWTCPGVGGGFGGDVLPAGGCGAGENGLYGGTGQKLGGGGAAYAQDGGDAGGASATGGLGGEITSCPGESLIPLRGGSGGGGARQDGGATVFSPGGSGGGAIQITALTSITIHTADSALPALIDVGGAGGRRTAEISDGSAWGGGGGGGSGGAVLLEAPAVAIDDASIYAGGGGGGTGGDAAGCASGSMCGDGDAGMRATFAALGGTSLTPMIIGGNGGTGSEQGQGFAPQNGGAAGPGSGSAGGGGSAGKLRVNTVPGGFTTSLFVVTAVPSTGTLTIQ